jgi:integrase
VISRTFERLVARSGRPRIRFHDVRHAHASLLLKAGVPIKVVSERLGQPLRASPSTCSGGYCPACTWTPLPG